MQETSEEKVNENAAGEQSSQESKRGVIAGLLLAAGTMLVVGAKIRSKVDIAKIRQQLFDGKLLPLKATELTAESGDHEGQGTETTAPTIQPADTSDDPGA